MSRIFGATSDSLSSTTNVAIPNYVSSAVTIFFFCKGVTVVDLAQAFNVLWRKESQSDHNGQFKIGRDTSSPGYYTRCGCFDGSVLRQRTYARGSADFNAWSLIGWEIPAGNGSILNSTLAARFFTPTTSTIVNPTSGQDSGGTPVGWVPDALYLLGPSGASADIRIHAMGIANVVPTTDEWDKMANTNIGGNNPYFSATPNGTTTGPLVAPLVLTGGKLVHYWSLKDTDTNGGLNDQIGSCNLTASGTTASSDAPSSLIYTLSTPSASVRAHHQSSANAA